MSIQAIGTNNIVALPEKPKLPPPDKKIDLPLLRMPDMPGMPGEHREYKYPSADGKSEITIISGGAGEDYKIKVTKKQDGWCGTPAILDKPEIRTVTREELEALVNGDKNKNPWKIDPRTFRAQENNPEGVGENLSLIA